MRKKTINLFVPGAAIVTGNERGIGLVRGFGS